MIRFLLFSLSLFLLCTFSFGNENKGKEILGTWEVVKKNGRDVTKDNVIPVQVFTEKEISFGSPKGNTIKGTYSVDQTKTPAQITIVFSIGEKKATIKGIYKIEANKLIQKTAPDTKEFQYPKDFSVEDKYETLELVKKNQ
jgi:uncharacterized protein (TIGR03067 family)